MTDDERWMAHAVALASARVGATGGNPTVGCVLVREGLLVAEAVTALGGRPHAEEQALAAAGETAGGATAYVTLEPCAERSSGAPSCTDRLMRAGIARVVLGADDSSRYAGGRGPARLVESGVDLTRGVLLAECQALLTDYRPAAAHPELQQSGAVGVSVEN
jgi:diaminohydroxyphosphoribosylaminopyrimidine deaminase/5-amino-6-(5-phosphoribosylamino)uracil reductase